LGSLLAGWFLGSVDQTDAAQAVPALHKAFLALGGITILSSLTFWTLHPDDGNNVSNRRVRGRTQVALAGDATVPVGK